MLPDLGRRRSAILASEDFIKKHKLQANAVEILGMAMTTDFSSTFDDKSSMKLVGYDMTKAAARRVYEQSGVGPENVRRRRAARLLLGQRADHVRGARPVW